MTRGRITYDGHSTSTAQPKVDISSYAKFADSFIPPDRLILLFRTLHPPIQKRQPHQHQTPTARFGTIQSPCHSSLSIGSLSRHPSSHWSIVPSRPSLTTTGGEYTKFGKLPLPPTRAQLDKSTTSYRPRGTIRHGSFY